MDSETLVIRVQAVASGVQEGVDAAKASLKGLDQSNQASSDEAQKAAKETAEAYKTIESAAAAALNIVIGSIQKGIQASNDYANAMMGLKSTAEGTGNSFGQAKQFIDSYTSDGLIPAADAATALKNLLARGYSDEQASAVLTRLKDAAAFGRESTLSLGDAVKSATESLKDEKNTLSDSAGVTKNVSDMWADYAGSIGKSVGDLTQAEKVQAEYNGIMAETAGQVGNAAQYSQSFSGVQAQYAAEGTKLWQAYGDAMKPVLEVLMKVLGEGAGALASFISEHKTLVAVLVSGATAALAFVSAAKGIQALIGIMKALQVATAATTATMATNPFGWAALAVSAIAMLVAGLASMETASEKANRELQESKDKLDSMQSEQQSFSAVAAEYEELSNKTHLTAEESERLNQIQRDLVSVYGLSATGIDEYGNAIVNSTTAVQEHNDALKASLALQQQTVLKDSDKVKSSDDKDLQKLANERKKIEDQKKQYEESLNDPIGQQYGDYFRDRIQQQNDLLDKNTEDQAKIFQKQNLNMQLAASVAVGIADSMGAKLDDGLRGASLSLVKYFVDQGKNYTDAANAAAAALQESSGIVDWFNQQRNELIPAGEALGDTANAAIQTVVDGIAGSFAEGLTSDDKKAQITQALSSMLDDEELQKLQGDLESQMQTLSMGIEVPADQIANLKEQIGERISSLLQGVNVDPEAINSITEAIQNMGNIVPEATGKTEEYAQALKDLQDDTKAAKVIDQYAQSARKAAKEKALIETLKTAKKGTKEYDDALQNLASVSGISAESIAANLSAVEPVADADAQSIYGLVDYMLRAANVNMDSGNILEQLQNIASGANSAEASAASLVLQLMSLGGVTIDDKTGKVSGLGPVTSPTPKPSGGGGGGGGSKKSAYDTQIEEIEHLKQLDQLSEAQEIARLENIQRKYAKSADDKKDIEERLYQARKDYQEKQYQDELDALDRRKDMDELTVQQEIDGLNEILAHHAQTIDQRIELEQRLHDAQKELRDSEVEQIDTLNDGIVSALQARYEEQQRIEDERIQASIDGWKNWADESKKAIQAQIDALDELSKSEDREAQDAEELRKIEATKQLIVYEKDDYNREQLENELARLEEDRETRLRKQSIEDQKAQLQDQMKAVDDKATSEQNALSDQMTQVDAAYEERLKSINLQAEAEQMLERSNQQEILTIIEGYAPDYEATGKTLGERLYDGFKSAVSDITVWFAGLNGQIEDYQQQLAQSAMAAATGFYQTTRTPASQAPAQPAGVTVYQENNFNQPVETPAETARRVKQANEALAQQVLLAG